MDVGVIGVGTMSRNHVRVFPDEVRGHSEISYEEDAALKALLSIPESAQNPGTSTFTRAR